MFEQNCSLPSVQDIAFFDGFPTGQLTSRLTQDTSAMISPLNTILNSMLSSLFLLVGGLFMCLYTSWRLHSRVHFNFPVVYIMNVYAQWSRGLNSKYGLRLGMPTLLRQNPYPIFGSSEPLGVRRMKFEVWSERGSRFEERSVTPLSAQAPTRSRITSTWEPGFSFLVMEAALRQYAQTHRGKTDHISLYWQLINSSYQNLTGVFHR